MLICIVHIIPISIENLEIGQLNNHIYTINYFIYIPLITNFISHFHSIRYLSDIL